MLRKKAEDIEGVSNASFVDLKAVLYKREQDLKRYVPGGDNNFTKRLKKRRRTLEQENDLFQGPAKRNKGIEDRIHRDKKLWEEEADLTPEQLRAKLMEKARKYKELQSRTDYTDEDPSDDTPFLVDFERKRWEEEKYKEKTEEDETSIENLHFLSKLSNFEEPAKGIQFSRDALDKYKPGGSEYEEARESRVNAILQLSQETLENRQKKASIKQKREQEKLRRLQMIKEKAKEKQNKQIPPDRDK